MLQRWLFKLTRKPLRRRQLQTGSVRRLACLHMEALEDRTVSSSLPIVPGPVLSTAPVPDSTYIDSSTTAATTYGPSTAADSTNLNAGLDRLIDAVRGQSGSALYPSSSYQTGSGWGSASSGWGSGWGSATYQTGSGIYQSSPGLSPFSLSLDSGSTNSLTLDVSSSSPTSSLTGDMAAAAVTSVGSAVRMSMTTNSITGAFDDAADTNAPTSKASVAHDYTATVPSFRSASLVDSSSYTVGVAATTTSTSLFSGSGSISVGTAQVVSAPLALGATEPVLASQFVKPPSVTPSAATSAASTAAQPTDSTLTSTVVTTTSVASPVASPAIRLDRSVDGIVNLVVSPRSGGTTVTVTPIQDVSAFVRSNRNDTPPPDQPTPVARNVPRPDGDGSAAAPVTPANRLPADLPDGSLLQRFAVNNEQAAFATLVARHERFVLGICQRVLGDSHAAEDAFQATFLVLARKAGALDSRNPLTGWLYKVAYHLSLRVRATTARQREREKEVAVEQAKPSAEADANLERQELRRVIHEELQRLPEKYRAPLTLCYLDGRTHEEAAREIGVPRGSMAKRISEGLDLLRNRMTARGLTI